MADSDTFASQLGDLTPLRKVIGDARVIALSEPFHGGHEPLFLRNRVIRWCVLTLNCTAIALETGLAPSKLLDDYVRGRSQGGTTSDSVLASAFDYGFGSLQENLDLLHWLRAFNMRRPDAARVAVYGIDISAAGFEPTSRSLDAVLEYLDRADPEVGRFVRAGDPTISESFASDKFPELSAADRDRVTSRIVDIVALMRAKRLAFTLATGREAYEWALRQAVNAEQDVMYLRRIPRGLLRRLMAGLDSVTPKDSIREGNALREIAMADNLSWVIARQPPNGRVLLFEHFSHVQGVPLSIDDPRPAAKLVEGLEGAGMYMRAVLGADFVVVGTYFGESLPGDPKASRALAADSQGIEGLLATAKLGAYMLDMRELPSGSLRAFFERTHGRRGGNSGDMRIRARPMLASDALFYFPRITPAHSTLR